MSASTVNKSHVQTKLLYHLTKLVFSFLFDEPAASSVVIIHADVALKMSKIKNIK